MFSGSRLYFLGRLCLVLATAISVATTAALPQDQELKVYPIPDGVTQGTSFDVQVRSRGEAKWQTLDTYQIGLHEINTTTGSAATRLSSMAYFDFSGTVDVSVYYKVSTPSTVRIRPDSYAIPYTVRDNTIYFSLSEPRDLVVQVNNQTFDLLHLLASPIETDVTSPHDPDVMYYGPGVQNVSGSIHVPSGKTVYIAGGAIFPAGLDFTNTSNAAVRGHGVIYKPSSGLVLGYSKNITIDGPTLVNANFNAGQAEDITIRNVRSFSATQWGDGMDFYCCKNILIDNVFMRNSDDCIAIYDHRDDWYGNSTNITIQNSSLWADVAHPINIGTHGNTDDPETMSDLTIRNLDILDHREPQMLYQGCIAINPGDGNLVRDVLVEDVRVEDFRWGQLINMRVMYNDKYNTSPGRGISNVTIRNLSYNGSHGGTCIFVGYDEDRTIEYVTFQNLTINGNAIYDAMEKPSWYLTTDFIPAFANEHVTNLTFLE